MTKDDIIRMAREAASEDGTTKPDKNVVLYAAKTRKFLERFAELVAAAEREACAKVCDEVQQKNEDDGAWLWEAKNCAAAIRARSVDTRTDSYSGGVR